MRNLSNVVIVIMLSLYSLTGYSGTVTGQTSYAGSNTLNAADLNNDNTVVKTAVDDNDSRITLLENNLSTGYVSVSAGSASVFEGNAASTVFSNFGNYLFPRAGTGTTVFASQSIQIPHGVTMDSLNCVILDNHTTGLVTVDLYRTIDTTTRDLIFTAGTSSAFASATHVTSSDATPTTNGFEIIDNQLYSYFLYITFTDGDNFDTGIDSVKLSRCNISYTY